MGVVKNSSQYSSGGESGHITLMEGVQFIFIGRSFEGTSDRVGGSLYPKEKSQAILRRCHFTSIMARETGGVFAVFSAEIFMHSLSGNSNSLSKEGFYSQRIV
jgi:hypothetical protein